MVQLTSGAWRAWSEEGAWGTRTVFLTDVCEPRNRIILSLDASEVRSDISKALDRVVARHWVDAGATWSIQLDDRTAHCYTDDPAAI